MAASSRLAAGTFDVLRRTPRMMNLPAFRAVAPTFPSVISMPLGLTYESLFFRFTIATVPASLAQIQNQVSKIRLVIDGDAKIDASGAELIALFNFWNSRYGKTAVVDGVLRIDLSRPWEQEISAQDGPGWGCAVGVPGGVGSFTCEVTLASGATIDAIEGRAEYTAPTPLGRHFVLRRMPDSLLSAGDKVMSDWPKLDIDIAWYALHIDKSAGTGNLITEVALKVDQRDEIERCKYGFIQSEFERYGCTQQTGFTHIPFARRGRPLEALPAVFQDCRLTIAASASLGNFNLLVESLEGTDPAVA